jgi:hypothetical protein
VGQGLDQEELQEPKMGHQGGRGCNEGWKRRLGRGLVCGCSGQSQNNDPVEVTGHLQSQSRMEVEAQLGVPLI